MNREELNQVYKILDKKAHEFLAPFLSLHKGMPCTCGYFNGHYRKNPEGEYEMDYFLIPVISVEGNSYAELLGNIGASAEEEIGFAFEFPVDMNAREMFEFAKLLKAEGFYY